MIMNIIARSFHRLLALRPATRRLSCLPVTRCQSPNPRVTKGAKKPAWETETRLKGKS